MTLPIHFEWSRGAAWFAFSLDIFSDAIYLHVIVAKRGFFLEIEDRQS